MKSKIACLLLGLFLAVPGLGKANMVPDTTGKQLEKPCDCEAEETKHEHGMHRDWQAKMAERQKQLLSSVEKYTPDKKKEWEAVLKERNALRTKWMSPENAGKREQWKKEKMQKMTELKKQLDEGKITKEEFIKKAHGEKDMMKWKTFHDLSLAVEKNDSKKAAETLNQLLLQFKEHNAKLKEKLGE